MFKKGDIIFYKLDAKTINIGDVITNDRFYIENITKGYDSKLYYQVYRIGENYTYSLREEYVNKNFITIQEHRKLIIEELI